ncbi:site-2 protease family protein, partial [Candidatus Amesbacteria bacterium]|nr:site-2 protease family protein [Candidatus Amesbacteria bacterium]
MSTAVVFLGILSILVMIHELGHFLTARYLGIKVEELAFGLPFTRPIFKFKKGETQYAIYPLLFGGFVRLYGEETQAEDKKRSFWDRGRKQRMMVIAAGVMMNLVLAMVAFVGLYAHVGVPQGVVEKVTVVRVDADSPAQGAGLKENDVLLAVEGKGGGVGVNMTVERGDNLYLFEGIVSKNRETLVVNAVPRLNPPEGQGALGVVVAGYPYLESAKCKVQSAKCVIGAIGAGVKSTGTWMGRVIEGLRGMGKSLVEGKKPEGVSGPVGIYQLTGVVATGGFWPVLELMAVLSVNLAVFNVLPIPALDGGRMLFIWVEWARGKRMDPRA